MIAFEASLSVVGASLSDAGRRELELAIQEVNEPGPFLALTHGDVAPGNAFFDGRQLRLFDFETSDLRHALLDGSFARLRYLHSVWAGRIPDPIQHRIMEPYRAELVRGCPEAAVDHRFNHALLSCAFAWVAALCEELPSAWHADRKWGRATTRQRLVAALEHFHELALACGEFEALATDVLNLAIHLRHHWPPSDCDIPTFPALQNLDVS